MANAKNFEMILDLMLNTKFDKSQVQKISSQIEKELSGISPELDVSQMEDELRDSLKAFEELVNITEDLEKTMSDIELNIDAAQAEKALQDLQGRLDVLQVFNEDDLDLDELEKVAKQLDEAFSSLNTDDAKNDIEALAQSYIKVREETEKQLATQKLALAEMKRTGKVGTKEFKDLENAINETEKEVKQLDTALDGIEIDIDTEDFDSVMARMEALGNAGQSMQDFAQKGEDVRDAMKKIQVQAGLTNEEVEIYRDLANQILDKKVDGLDTTANALNNLGVSARFLNDTLNYEQIAEFTSYAGKFAKAFDKDINEVTLKSANSMKTWGMETQDFFANLTVAAQQSGTTQDDLLDSVAEYSDHLKEAGFSAQQMFAFLGSKDATFNTDFIGDAIKELGVRLNDGALKKDMQDLFAEMPKSMQDSLQATIEAAENGEITVADMFGDITEEMNVAFDEGEISKTLTAKMQAALAGTKAEDLTLTKFNDIFQPKIDTKELNKAIDDALKGFDNIGSNTLWDKLANQFEVLKTNASRIFSPFIAGAGQATTAMSELAPSLMLMNQFDGSKLKQQFAGIGNSIKGLSSQAGALGKLGPAIFNPWTLGITAAVGGLTLFLTKTDKGKAIMERMSKSFQDIIKKLQPVFDGLMDYGEALLDGLFAFGELIYEVVITPVEILWELISAGIDLFNEMSGSTNESNSAFDAMGSTLTYLSKVISSVSGIFRDLAKFIGNTKDTIIGFVRNFPELLSAIMEYAQYYLNPANWFNSDEATEKEIKQNIMNVIEKSVSGAGKEAEELMEKTNYNLSLPKMNIKEAGTVKELNDYINLIKSSFATMSKSGKLSKEELEKLEKEKVKLITEAENKITEIKKKNADTTAGTGVSGQDAKTELELAEEIYNKKIKELEISEKQFELYQDQAIFEEGRERDLTDNLILENVKLDTLEKQKQALLETYKVVEDNEGNVSIGIKGADPQAIEEQLLSIDKSIQDQKENVKAVEVDIELSEDAKERLQEDINKQMEDLKIKQLEYDIDAGINIDFSQNEILDIYKNRLSNVMDELAEVNQDTIEGQEKYIELKNKELDLLDDIKSKEEEIAEQREKEHEKELERIEKEHNEKLDKLKLFYNQFNEIAGREYEKDLDKGVSSIDKDEEKALEALDNTKELDLISESDYQKKKNEIIENAEKERLKLQEEYEKKKDNLKEISRGVELQLETEKNRQLILEQQNKVNEEIALLEQKAKAEGGLSNADALRLDGLNKQLDGLEQEIKVKGELLGVATLELANEVNEAITGLFAGQGIDAVIENARDFFGVLAGILQAQISAFVLQWVTGSGLANYISMIPNPALQIAAWAVAERTINAAVKGITDPLFQNILSFSTGGSIAGAYDSPQIIQVGDASNVGGRNAEWVTRDVDIQAIVQMTVNEVSNVIVQEMRLLRNTLESQRLETTLRGKDIHLAMLRVSNSEKRAGY
jgi:hypothetical protein